MSAQLMRARRKRAEWFVQTDSGQWQVFRMLFSAMARQPERDPEILKKEIETRYIKTLTIQ
jgi:hypothetical protein